MAHNGELIRTDKLGIHLLGVRPERTTSATGRLLPCGKLEPVDKTRTIQLLAEQLCAMCLAEGRGPVRATCADHIAPHRGDFVKFQMGDARRSTLPHSSRKARRVPSP
jgi:hypothetical protein